MESGEIDIGIKFGLDVVELDVELVKGDPILRKGEMLLRCIAIGGEDKIWMRYGKFQRSVLRDPKFYRILMIAYFGTFGKGNREKSVIGFFDI